MYSFIELALFFLLDGLAVIALLKIAARLSSRVAPAHRKALL
jgi:hypothetical protein